MKAEVSLKEKVCFEGVAGSGNSVTMDGPPEFGGENKGPRPMEMLLLGMGGCASFDVVHILRKRKLSIDDCVCEIEAERAETEPKVFTKIHLHFKVSGEGVTDKAVAKAVELSADKYCSASIMLGKTADVTHSYEIV
jgi:putative redox protein